MQMRICCEKKANALAHTRACAPPHEQNEVTNNKNTCLIHSLECNALCTKFADNSAFAKLLLALCIHALFIVATSSHHFPC